MELSIIPNPNTSELNLCFQAARTVSRVSYEGFSTCPASYTVFTGHVPGKANLRNKPMSTAHSQLDAYAGSPISTTHFAHQFTFPLHTQGRQFLLVHTRHKIGTFQWNTTKSHKRHNCDLQCSAYTHYTRAYLARTVSATLASLLFPNTGQLQPTTITH